MLNVFALNDRPIANGARATGGRFILEAGILVTPQPRFPNPAICLLYDLRGALVPRFINTVTFADEACQARSRSEEEAMQGTSATTSDAEIARNPHQPGG
ncbi:MAG: hypothetical protein HY644_05640 [Acidobacteria bacterium]|nr:hypothetical protein [Acidobacteriota bacterium]